MKYGELLNIPPSQKWVSLVHMFHVHMMFKSLLKLGYEILKTKILNKIHTDILEFVADKFKICSIFYLVYTD